MRLVDLLLECLRAVAREARRTAPMAAGIVWGVASVFVLVAVGRGFEAHQRAVLAALGDSFLLLRVNRATTMRGDVRGDSFVRIDGDDIEAMQAGATAVEALSPKAANWFIQAFRGDSITRATALGVDPEYAEIVHVPLAEGRWLDANDMAQELPVAVIGWGVRQELFGDEPCIGKEMRMIFTRRAGEETVQRRITVVGAIADEELAGDEIYTSNRRAIFLPFPTWERMSPEDFQFFVLRPREAAGKEAALDEVRRILAHRHNFDPESKNTLVPYFDAYERKERIDSVFGGMRVFLGAVGALILLLGAIGVANVVLMSVTARTSEFALRRALGCKRRWVFAQVFLEASAVCAASGVVGFLLGTAGVALMGQVPLPEGFAPPRVELGAAWLPGALLLAVSLGAALWPAWRAARLAPAAALRGGTGL
jgi:putative ABC transport system permease protein